MPHTRWPYRWRKIRINEVKNVIKRKINSKKAPSYDLITGKVLQELSQKDLQATTQIYNAILRIEYFTCQWKVGQIIMIAKPGKKNSDDRASCWPISLLPILSKILEKILLKRLTPTIHDSKRISSHQFGFRNKHGTIEQAHRLVNKIHNDLENKRYYWAAFIDISQAFDKVWHTGLFYKLKSAFTHTAYTILN